MGSVSSQFQTSAEADGSEVDDVDMIAETMDTKPVIQDFRISISKKIVSMGDFDPSDAEPEDLEDYLDDGDMSEKVGVTYQIKVTYGDAKTPLKNVTITDALPEGLNYARGTSKLWFEQKSPDAVLSDEEKRVKNVEPLGNNTVLLWSVPEIKPGRWLYIKFDTIVSAADIPKCMLFENTARAEGYAETKTVWVERKTDDVNAVIYVGGEPYNCQGPI